jgi:hypothetical protein
MCSLTSVSRSAVIFFVLCFHAIFYVRFVCGGLIRNNFIFFSRHWRQWKLLFHDKILTFHYQRCFKSYCRVLSSGFKALCLNLLAWLLLFVFHSFQKQLWLKSKGEQKLKWNLPCHKIILRTSLHDVFILSDAFEVTKTFFIHSFTSAWLLIWKLLHEMWESCHCTLFFSQYLVPFLTNKKKFISRYVSCENCKIFLLLLMLRRKL